MYIYLYIYICLNIYQLNRLQKKSHKIYQNLPKKEKQKSKVVNVTKISQRRKFGSLLSIEKNIIE